MDRSACYHAPPMFAYQNRDLTLQIIVPDEESDLIDLSLYWQAEGQGVVRMLPTDGISVLGDSFSVYAATIKAAALTGERLQYHFEGKGLKTQCYEIPLAAEKAHQWCDVDAASEGDYAPWQEGTVKPTAILPLAPRGRVYLSQGELSVCFATAGCYPEAPIVYVKINEAFLPYRAEASAKGYYEAIVPYEQLSRLSGHVLYYIEVSAGGCTASYGNANAPLSVRLIDNMGPTVLSAYPENGQALGMESCPEITLLYEDVSGVDLNRSILCLDGKNISNKAQWGEKSVKFRPARPLEQGVHMVEVALRDSLGNRTYHRIDFTVGDADFAKKDQSSERAPRARSVRAALFFAGVWSTLKELFSNKD